MKMYNEIDYLYCDVAGSVLRVKESNERQSIPVGVYADWCWGGDWVLFVNTESKLG
jgi:hypothetical protein